MFRRLICVAVVMWIASMIDLCDLPSTRSKNLIEGVNAMLKRFSLILSAILIASATILPQISFAAALDKIVLPAPKIAKGMSVMTALNGRHSTRDYVNKALKPQQLGNILWAANGINRPDTSGRVNPAAHGTYLIDVYAILSDGIYLYDPKDHALNLIASGDHRNIASKNPGFARSAPLNLVYVVNDVPSDKPHNAAKSAVYNGVAAGTMAQSVALVLESEGLGGCVRGSVLNDEFAKVAMLNENQTIILAQTIGVIK